MPTYPQAIAAAPNLVSWWKLDETSGTTAADSKGSNPGTYTGGYTLNQTGMGNAGVGVLLNGSTGYITVPTSASLEITGAFSIEALVKMTNASRSNQYTQIAGKDHSAFSSPYQNYALQAEFGGGQWLGAAIGQAGPTQTTVHANAVPVAGTWYQVVLTWDPAPAHNNLNIYVNGALDNYLGNGVDKQGTLSNAAQPWVMGAGNFGGTINSFLPGTLSNVSVANAAWSAAEVLVHYNALSGSADSDSTLAVTGGADTLVASAPLLASTAATEGADTLVGAAPVIATPSSLAATEGADTLVAAGVYAAVATFATTTADDTLVGISPDPGAAAILAGADTLVAAADSLMLADGAMTNGDDTLETIASPIMRGTLAVTAGDDVLVGAATQIAVAALGVTEGADTLVGASTQTATAALAVTEGADTLVAFGNADLAVNAVAGSIANGNDTLVAAAAPIAGATLAITEGADVLVGASGSGPGVTINSLGSGGGAGSLRYWREMSMGTAAELVACSSVLVKRLWGVPLAKAERGHSQLKGYAGLFHVPLDASLGGGFSFLFVATDDGDQVADLGKTVRIGITLKRLPPNAVLDITTGAAAELFLTATLSTTSGAVSLTSLTVPVGSLPAGLAPGDMVLCQFRRIGSDTVHDTCPGRVLLLGIDISTSAELIV